MREILEQCVRLDSFAHDTYRSLAEVAEDEELAETLASLAAEEKTHTDWWRDLIRSWDEGLLPDIVSEPVHVMEELEDRWRHVTTVVPDDLQSLTSRDLIAIAARLEFFMLFPVFGELIDLVEPGQARKRHAAYHRHLEHVTEAIDRVAADDPLVSFLADVLRRVSEDNRELARHATRDALTGLRNRRALDSLLRQWIAWSARYGRPLGVLLTDLDEFKRVNDEHGHQVGDRVLAAVADALRETVRESDMVARYGGDEFAVIAPEAEEQELSALSARLVDALSSLEIRADDVSLHVTGSVGSVVVRPDGAASTPETVLSSADRSLYEAKESGRNRAGTVRVIPAPGS
jgi:diguanylate cyclase (GGDEF)-like protein